VGGDEGDGVPDASVAGGDPMTTWMSPLRRAERLLEVRLLELERTLDRDTTAWPVYLETLDRFLHVRALLHPPDPPLTRGQVRRAYEQRPPGSASDRGGPTDR
jgi:hypothetical protein